MQSQNEKHSKSFGDLVFVIEPDPKDPDSSKRYIGLLREDLIEKVRLMESYLIVKERVPCGFTQDALDQDSHQEDRIVDWGLIKTPCNELRDRYVDAEHRRITSKQD